MNHLSLSLLIEVLWASRSATLKSGENTTETVWALLCHPSM